MTLTNEETRTYAFLEQMQNDTYYPAELVAKGQGILHDLCLQIEAGQPQTPEELFALTHAATEQFNQLNGDLEAQDSELETVARENIGKDMEFIAQAYGFQVDVENLIENREW
ncbi:DUF5713 family protein [Deinococcus altitudinis]|uniref:DUF5713 family protein n=1 Tax=Deinococcus altitudinis TaxID=468914 RepID=UPI003891BD94